MENIDITKMIGVLGLLFALAIIIESAWESIFKWRVYKNKLSGIGLKTPIILIGTAWVLWPYNIDLIAAILNAAGIESKPTDGGQFITAMVIAGGSSRIRVIYDKISKGIKQSDNKPE